MTELVSDTVAALARAIGPDPGPVLDEMDERGEREDFPTIGPELGAWLRVLARAVDAKRVFEFGSGFGYSAAWVAPALPDDGKIVLTEVDADELADAEDYLERAGHATLARFEHGDAIETIEDYEGPFDLVLIDNEKDRYAEAFHAVREKVAPGGVVVADNAMAGGSIDAEAVHALLVGETVEADDMSAGIATYLDAVRKDESFETSLLPLGEGLAVSVRLQQ